MWHFFFRTVWRNGFWAQADLHDRLLRIFKIAVLLFFKSYRIVLGTLQEYFISHLIAEIDLHKVPQHYNNLLFFAKNEILFLSSQQYLYDVMQKILYLGDNILILFCVTILDQNLSTSSQFWIANIFCVEELYDNFYLTDWL